MTKLTSDNTPFPINIRKPQYLEVMNPQKNNPEGREKNYSKERLELAICKKIDRLLVADFDYFVADFDYFRECQPLGEI